jgi:hypothetical protein
METNQRKLRLMLRERANVSFLLNSIWLDSNLRKQMPRCTGDPQNRQGVEISLLGTKSIRLDCELATNNWKINRVFKQFVGSFTSFSGLLTHGDHC